MLGFIGCRAWRTQRSSAAQCDSHSSNFSGRLSSAEGRRKPYSTRTSLRERSPLYMAPSCGMVWWLSSMMSSALSRQVIEQARRRLAGGAARQIARVVLDTGAVARPPSSSPCRTSCAARGAAPPAACRCRADPSAADADPHGSGPPRRSGARAASRSECPDNGEPRHLARYRPGQRVEEVIESIVSSKSSTLIASRSDSAGKYR